MPTKSWRPWGQKVPTARSFGQDGEDVPISKLLCRPGFYVDIGAHHPDRFSVTKRLYQSGWSGINADNTTRFERDFNRRRTRDTNIRTLVGTRSEVDFYRFLEEALNTSDAERAEFLMSLGWKLSARERQKVMSLTKLLEMTRAPAQIDLLSVDVEGAELDVLSSLDWQRWSVEAALVEIGLPAYAVPEHEVSLFLNHHGLLPVLCFARSTLYLSKNHYAMENFRSSSTSGESA